MSAELSDVHKIIVSVKKHNQEKEPKIVKCRNYSNFPAGILSFPSTIVCKKYGENCVS